VREAPVPTAWNGRLVIEKLEAAAAQMVEPPKKPKMADPPKPKSKSPPVVSTTRSDVVPVVELDPPKEAKEVSVDQWQVVEKSKKAGAKAKAATETKADNGADTGSDSDNAALPDVKITTDAKLRKKKAKHSKQSSIEDPLPVAVDTKTSNAVDASNTQENHPIPDTHKHNDDGPLINHQHLPAQLKATHVEAQPIAAPPRHAPAQPSQPAIQTQPLPVQVRAAAVQTPLPPSKTEHNSSKSEFVSKDAPIKAQAAKLSPPQRKTSSTFNSIAIPVVGGVVALVLGVVYYQYL